MSVGYFFVFFNFQNAETCNNASESHTEKHWQSNYVNITADVRIAYPMPKHSCAFLLLLLPLLFLRSFALKHNGFLCCFCFCCLAKILPAPLLSSAPKRFNFLNPTNENWYKRERTLFVLTGKIQVTGTAPFIHTLSLQAFVCLIVCVSVRVRCQTKHF